MTDYKSMYTDLFNAITEAIDVLTKAQQKAENTYINTTEPFYAFDESVDTEYADGYEC